MSPPKKEEKCYGHSVPVYHFYVVGIISQKIVITLFLFLMGFIEHHSLLISWCVTTESTFLSHFDDIIRDFAI